MANRNFANSRIYSGHVMPVQIDCNFVVDSSNGNGLGIRSLKGAYVQNVFMHTSATAGAGNSNPATPGISVVNPNPASGTIVVQLQDNYARLLGGSYSIVSPVGTPVKIDASDAALTVGVAYTITTVGDATAADWLAVGLPAGVVPSVGAVFIAKATGHGTSSTSYVAPSAAAGSGLLTIETVGNTNQALSPTISAQGFGGQIVLQTRNASGASAASAIAAPADGSVIQLTFLLSNSSVLIGGE